MENDSTPEFKSGQNVKFMDIPKRLPIYVSNYSKLRTEDLEEYVQAYFDCLFSAVSPDNKIPLNMNSGAYTLTGLANMDPYTTKARDIGWFFNIFSHGVHLVFTTYTSTSKNGYPTPYKITVSEYASYVSEFKRWSEQDLEIVDSASSLSIFPYCIRPSFSNSQISNVIGVRDLASLHMSPVEIMIMQETSSVEDFSLDAIFLHEHQIKRQIMAELDNFISTAAFYNINSVRTTFVRTILMDEYYYKRTGRILRMRYSDKPVPSKNKAYREYVGYMNKSYDDLRQVQSLIAGTNSHFQAVSYIIHRIKSFIEKSNSLNLKVDFLTSSFPAFEQLKTEMENEVLQKAIRTHELALKAGSKIINYSNDKSYKEEQ